MRSGTRPDWPISEAELGALIERIALRESVALTVLHQATNQFVRSCVRRLIENPWNAEEVLQDVYRHIWVHAADYSPLRGAPGAWIYVIARSRALDHIRGNWKVGLTCNLTEDAARFSVSDPEASYSAKWRSHLVRGALAELPPAQQQAIQLSFFEGCTHVEIADRTGLPLGTVKSRIRNALCAMRQALPHEITACR